MEDKKVTSCSECDCGIPKAVVDTEDCVRCEYFRKRVQAKVKVELQTYDNDLFQKSLKNASKMDGINLKKFDLPTTTHHCMFHKGEDGIWRCACGMQRHYL